MSLYAAMDEISKRDSNRVSSPFDEDEFEHNPSAHEFDNYFNDLHPEDGSAQSDEKENACLENKNWRLTIHSKTFSKQALAPSKKQTVCFIESVSDSDLFGPNENTLKCLVHSARSIG